MVANTSDAMSQIWQVVHAWPPQDRLNLARRILDSLATNVQPSQPLLRAADLIGIWKDIQPTPTDEEIDQIRFEEIMKKHSP